MAMPDLWERLARLDQCCDLGAQSRSNAPHGVIWTVRVTHRDGTRPPIMCEGSSLVETLSDALAKAEALTWLPAR